MLRFKNYLNYYAGYNKIFITADHDFIIRAYDSNGKPEYTIERDYPLKRLQKKIKQITIRVLSFVSPGMNKLNIS